MNPTPRSPAGKLKLGENHRRVFSIVLRGLEQMCMEIESWLEKRPGLLCRVEMDLSSEQQEDLRQLVGRMRAEIRRLAAEIEVDPGVKSVRRAVRAVLSSNIVQLEESDASRLRGYGQLSEEAAIKIDAEMAHLIALLEQMVGAVGSRGTVKR